MKGAVSLNYPNAYVEYLVHFHGTRDYFECHEVLEEHWKNTAPKARDSHWVGLIQIAVSLYHYRRGNIAGATRMLSKAITNLRNKKEEIHQLGLQPDQLLSLLETINEDMLANEPYKSVTLPIQDENLLIRCKQLCSQSGYVWDAQSDMADEALVHKHLNRDRSEVIAERNEQLRRRQYKKIEEDR